MKPNARRALVLSAVAVASLWGAASRAADPAVDECMGANEDAQALRVAGALLQARAHLEICVAATCPGPVRADCLDQLRAVEEATPTIVLGGVDGRPPRRPVTLDGHPVSGSAAAAAISVDPGVHRLVFASDDRVPATLTIVVREGEKDRRVELVVPAASFHAAKDSPQRPVGLVIGGVGLAGLAMGGIFAVLAKTTDAHALADECGGNASTCSIAGIEDGNRAHAEARTSTIALIGGGLLLGTGALIYFTAPGGHLVSLGGSAGADHAGLTLNGEFL